MGADHLGALASLGMEICVPTVSTVPNLIFQCVKRDGRRDGRAATVPTVPVNAVRSVGPVPAMEGVGRRAELAAVVAAAEAVGDGAGVRPVEIDRAGYFRCFSRRNVDGVDFTREIPVFLPSTVFSVDGRIFGKNVVARKTSTFRRQNIGI